MFERPQGMVGLSPGLVAEVVAVPDRERIGAVPEAVNVDVLACLSVPGRSVTLAPTMPTKDELYDRAVDHVADGDLDAAIAAYREALALAPDFVDAIHGLGMAYADKGLFDEAITWGKRLVELAPDDTLAHTSLSMFYQRAGMIPEAEAEGAKARMLDWKRQLAEQKLAEEQKKGGGGGS